MPVLNMEYPLKSRNFRESPWSLYLYILSVVALVLYLYGFFPFEYSPNLNVEKNNKEINNLGRRHIDKLAFIVIDALRQDFVIPKGNEKLMPFTHSAILNNEACLVTTVAHSPTVTLPRLKAITSGMVSTYMDVVLNFMTANFKEDNFIKIATSNGLKLVFYGDDTWLKLFPDSFIRSEGTNSFFALDYTEVDNNVTRHIDEELNKSDWDIIILHYLGLDHIGHTEGPNSPTIKPKLLEMDNVVEKIFNGLKKLEENKGLKTMLIVTGDHGMKDSGSHGGVTYSEVTVPLVSLGKPCVVLPGWPEEHKPFQIDITPTLSALFGQRLPAKNMGKIIPGLLNEMNTEEILRYLELNRLELSKFNVLGEDFTMSSSMCKGMKYELEKWFLTESKDEGVLRHITEKYFQCLHQCSLEIVKSNSDFKLPHLILGVVLLWIFLIILMSQMLKNFPKPHKKSHWCFVLGTVFHAFSLLSSSFIEEEHQTWYFFWSTLCVLLFLESTHLKRLLNTHRAKFLAPWFLIAVIHRILRKLNQTGDKWAFLPDIKFYLHTEGQIWLFILFLLGLGLVFWCVYSEKCSFYQLLTCVVTLLAVTGYRIANGSFQLKFLEIYPSYRGTLEIFLFWASLFIFSVQTFRRKTPFHLVWLLFASLLLRPHNVILLPLEVFISKEIHRVFHKSDDIIWNNLAHVWLGNLFYFYQGNGNSLSNVDVASGFIGIQSYNPIYVGIMMAVHTSNAHILSFMLSPKMNLIYALARIIPLAMYCTASLFQLNHLFIWSVFSPKLLYEANTTVICMILMTVNTLVNSRDKNILNH